MDENMTWSEGESIVATSQANLSGEVEESSKPSSPVLPDEARPAILPSRRRVGAALPAAVSLHGAGPVDAGAHVPPRHLPIQDDLDAHGGVTPRPLLPALAPGQRIRK